MCLINRSFGVDSDSICNLGIIGIIGYLNRGKFNLDDASRGKLGPAGISGVLRQF